MELAGVVVILETDLSPADRAAVLVPVAGGQHQEQVPADRAGGSAAGAKELRDFELVELGALAHLHEVRLSRDGRQGCEGL
jgi:hypothetical protein